MGLADLVAPEATPHRHNGQLGQDDGAADGCGHLLGALDAKTHVTIVVTNSHKSLEPGALTGPSLLLLGHNLQHLILESRAQEEVDDLKLLTKDTNTLIQATKIMETGSRRQLIRTQTSIK